MALFFYPGRGVIFKGTTIGMAPLEGMCSHENSGGINVVRQQMDALFFFYTVPLYSCNHVCANTDVCSSDAQGGLIKRSISFTQLIKL